MPDLDRVTRLEEHLVKAASDFQQANVDLTPAELLRACMNVWAKLTGKLFHPDDQV